MNRRLCISAISCVAVGGLLGSLAASGRLRAQEQPHPQAGREAPNAPVLPRPPAPFRGVIDLRAKDSKPDFPRPVQAPAGAPNVLLVLLDDVGFGASSTFGGPCNTPTLERLARSGLRYNQFHTTALCSPTRAALLTGRNHHSVHTACIMEGGTGFPGYDTVMGKDTATVAEILKQNGYNTAWFGKNHNVPDWQNSQNGPFDLWPTGLGFEHFYGFVGGDTSQWRPAAVNGTKPIEPYIGNPDYHFDDDMADRAIAWIGGRRPSRPTGRSWSTTPRAPPMPRTIPGRSGSRSTRESSTRAGTGSARRRSRVRNNRASSRPGARLTARPKEIPAWETLDADQKRVYARMMEIYAAYLEQTDHNVGRVIDAIDEAGQLDNTLVIYIVGDNGASAEGSMQGLLNEMTFFNGVPEDPKEVLRRADEIGTWKTYNHYPVGWAHAMCTPFQWTKQVASHYGGTPTGWSSHGPAGSRTRGACAASGTTASTSPPRSSRPPGSSPRPR